MVFTLTGNINENHTIDNFHYHKSGAAAGYLNAAALYLSDLFIKRGGVENRFKVLAVKGMKWERYRY